MSDSNMDFSDEIGPDGEPSMEDILASIRKVIAADSHDNRAADRNVEPRVGPSADFGETLVEGEMAALQEDGLISADDGDGANSGKPEPELETLGDMQDLLAEPQDSASVENEQEDEEDILELVAFIDEHGQNSAKEFPDEETPKVQDEPDFVIEVGDDGQPLPEIEDILPENDLETLVDDVQDQKPDRLATKDKDASDFTKNERQDEQIVDDSIEIAFDETLDLVIDEDASSFVTTPMGRGTDETVSKPKDAPAPQILSRPKPVDLQNGDAELATSWKDAIVEPVGEALKNAGDDEPQVDLPETSETTGDQKSELGKLMEDLLASPIDDAGEDVEPVAEQSEMSGALDMPGEDGAEDGQEDTVEAAFSDVQSLTTEFEAEQGEDAAEADDDIDLVKSLLSDLMGDDEASEDGEEGADGAFDVQEYALASDEVDTQTGILDEILDENIALETEQADAEADPDEAQSELAKIALEAKKEAAMTASLERQVETLDVEGEGADDEVVFDVSDIKSRLALAAGTAAMGGALASKGLQAELASSETDGQAQIDEQIDNQAEPQVQEFAQEARKQDTGQQDTGQQEAGQDNTGQDLSAQAGSTQAEIDTGALVGDAERVEPENTSNAALEEIPQLDTMPQTEETEDMMKPVDINKLVDEETDREASEAFASLNQAVRDKTKLEESGPPIGDLVQEALKPMLQEWLDKNLKTIVERAVTKEIKRISSGK